MASAILLIIIGGIIIIASIVYLVGGDADGFEILWTSPIIIIGAVLAVIGLNLIVGTHNEANVSCVGQQAVVVASVDAASEERDAARKLVDTLNATNAGGCIVDAGSPGDRMGAEQRDRLAEADEPGYVIGDTNAVSDAKVRGFDLRRIAPQGRQSVSDAVNVVIDEISDAAKKDPIDTTLDWECEPGYVCVDGQTFVSGVTTSVEERGFVVNHIARQVVKVNDDGSVGDVCDFDDESREWQC